MRRRLFALLSAVCLSRGIHVGADEPNAPWVSGRVVDESGTGVQGAHVIIAWPVLPISASLSPEDGKYWVFPCDRNGRFSIDRAASVKEVLADSNARIWAVQGLR